MRLRAVHLLILSSPAPTVSTKLSVRTPHEDRIMNAHRTTFSFLFLALAGTVCGAELPRISQV